MITWSIISMVVKPQEGGYTNVVTEANWLLTGIDGDAQARIGGRSALNPVQSEFTDYANLTEAQVLGWVMDILGPAVIAEMEASIQDQIAHQTNPPVAILPLPWG